jgi:hypothetical protein
MRHDDAASGKIGQGDVQTEKLSVLTITAFETVCLNYPQVSVG